MLSEAKSRFIGKTLISILSILLISGCQYHPMLVELMKPEDIEKLSTKELETLHDGQCILSNEPESKVGKELNKRYLKSDRDCINNTISNAKDVSDFENLFFYTQEGRNACEVARRNWFINKNPELDIHIKDAIKEGKVILGMNTEQVIASWGKPIEINRTVTRFINHEQWVYSYYDEQYLYFENGKLTGWQD